MWVYLRKERFPIGTYHKLRGRRIGLCKVLKKINNNSYRVELPGDFNISIVFNVVDLSPFHESEDDNSRASSSQAGEDDADGFDDQVVEQAMTFMEAFDCTPGVRTHV